MGTYSTGYVPDDPGHKRTPFHHFAARHPKAAEFSASCEANLPPVLDQNGSGSCVGHATACAIYAGCKAAGDPLPWVPSPDNNYRLARCVDRMPRPDGSLPRLVDEGAQPNQAFRAFEEWGVRPMGPRPPDGRMSDVDPRTVNDEPSLGDLEKDAESLLLGEYGIYTYGAQRGLDVRTAITNGFPVCAAVPGGSAAWQNYSGGVIGATGEPLDHYVTIFAYERVADGTFVYTLRNSWGEGYGENGNVRVNEAALNEFSDLVVASVRRAG